MFYKATAYNTGAIIFWSTDETKVERYIDWLNRDRDINVYHAEEMGEDYEDDTAFSMDEAGWDDFMEEAE